MSLTTRIRRWRTWLPLPTKDGFNVVEWGLLDANRLVLTGGLLGLVFASIMLIGTTWPFEMRDLLTETSTVQTILNTFLGGMILLVSIVVSINSIALSHDMTSIEIQKERVRGTTQFRRELGEQTDIEENPSDPATFLVAMSGVIERRAKELHEEMEGREGALSDEVREYANSIVDTADTVGMATDSGDLTFSVLWRGMGFDYEQYLDRSPTLNPVADDSPPDELQERVDDLFEALELFAIGKEYFKTLYYTREVSQLSRLLLVVALPAILFNASIILAINAGVLPDVWFFGLPPLHSFVAAAFTISLAPYLLLTSYMLRLATVARLTASVGIFSLN